MMNLTSQHINDYPDVLQKAFHNISITSDFEIIGSSHFKNFLYPNDYDLNFIWRDIYPYGFIDDVGRGVDRPFLNDKHYVHENFTFRLIPEGSNIDSINTTQVNDPTIDDCE